MTLHLIATTNQRSITRNKYNKHEHTRTLGVLANSQVQMTRTANNQLVAGVQLVKNRLLNGFAALQNSMTVKLIGTYKIYII